jgi:hypothetical protein
MKKFSLRKCLEYRLVLTPLSSALVFKPIRICTREKFPGYYENWGTVTVYSRADTDPCIEPDESKYRLVLTPLSRALVFQPIRIFTRQKFPGYYANWGNSYCVLKSRHWSLYWARWIQTSFGPNSMEQGSCFRANTNIHSAEIPWLLWKLKGQLLCIQEPTLIPVLSQMNPAHYFISRFFKIHCNIMPLCIQWSQDVVSWHDGFQLKLLRTFLSLLCPLLHVLPIPSFAMQYKLWKSFLL